MALPPRKILSNGEWRQDLAHASGITGLAVSRNGARIISAGMDRLAQVWDATTGELLLTYCGHTREVNAAAWSSDDAKLATTGSDKTVQVWDAATGALFVTYVGHTREVQALSWSSNGK